MSEEMCGYSGCRSESVAWIGIDGRPIGLCDKHLKDEYWPRDLIPRVAKARKGTA